MPKYTYQETPLIRELAAIMEKHEGPFTKMMLVELLSERHPEKYKQELKNEISAAVMIDKQCNQRFVSPKPMWWDLKER